MTSSQTGGGRFQRETVVALGSPSPGLPLQDRADEPADRSLCRENADYTGARLVSPFKRTIGFVL